MFVSILHKNAVLREAYPKDIRFFYTNTAGTSFGRKRTGVRGKALQIY